MCTRAKRMLNLALKCEENIDDIDILQERDLEHKSILTKCKLEKKNICDEYDVTEFEKDEDPWIEFNKWKNRGKESMNDQQFQIEEKHELNGSEKQDKSSTEFVDSSTSWNPNENEESDTISECQSKRSIIIPYATPIVHELSDLQGNIYNPLENPDINVVCETESPVTTNKDTDDTSRKVVILQNITLQPISEAENANKEIIAVPRRKNLNNQTFGLVGNSKSVVDVSHRKSRIWDKKDRCIYCNRDCTNFSRHLFRNHKEEDSIQRILQVPKSDAKRRQMINLIRKEGNLTLLDENKIRPVQRATQKYEGQENSENSQEFLPCPYCKGLYRLKSLRKHSKICSYNTDNGEKCNVASLGQNLLIFKASRKSFVDKLRLKDEVFSKMHADRASYNGKNDPVICQYAEDYLRKHKRPHIRNAVSNKIRELGRLLIPLQDIYGINTLLEAMNTKHYEKVVHAAQIISGYDTTLKTFQAPSLALHLKGILLSACLAAKTLLLKQDPILPVLDYEASLKVVKQFRSLVDERWKFDMASLALKDLNEKQGKTSQTLPITSDVIKFRECAVEVAEENLNILKENVSNRLAFKKLTEAALVLTILLNRKRVGDVQYIKVDSYTQATPSRNQEECLNVLSESEKLLSAHFKRIITIGKGSRSIPILFPKNVEIYVDTLLTARKKNQLIPKENPFLFALIGSKDKWMDGSSVLRKYAANCGAENPKTLTSSRLRKQIATVLQVLNLNENEKEQMASFMGHTMKTHSEFYRLPQDVYQTAKIAKLLLIMDKGKGAEFQGKALEEIDLHLERLNEESSEKMDSDIEPNNEENIQGKSQNSAAELKTTEENNECYFSSQPNEGISNIEQKKDKKERKEGQRGSWNNKQKNIMKEFFKKHISKKITPKKHECLQLKTSYEDMFKDKTWVQIKVFIYNTFQQQRQ